MHFATVSGPMAQRDATVVGLARSGWQPEPNTLLFAGNGRQAIAATFSALAAPGDRIGFEALTYPVAKALAERQGLVPVSLAVDEEGMLQTASAWEWQTLNWRQQKKSYGSLQN